MTKTIGELQAEAVQIKALCQGAEVLYDHGVYSDPEAPPDIRAASNALGALLPTIAARMATLALDLEHLEDEERRAASRDA